MKLETSGRLTGICITLLLVLVACGPQPTPTAVPPTPLPTGGACEGVRIVFFPGGYAACPFGTILHNGAATAAEHFGAEVEFMFSDWDPDKMVRQFEEAVATEPDGIAVMGLPGEEALEAAIENYRGGAKAKHELQGNVVCTCFGVTDKEIERVIQENDLTTVEQVTNYCKAGGGCGGCQGEIEKIIEHVQGQKVKEKGPTPTAKRGRLTNIEKIKLVQQTINEQIRPALRAHGGNIELVDVEGDKVTFSDTEGATTVQAGKNVKLPQGFPDDVPVYEKATILSVVSRSKDEFAVSLQTGDAVKEVAGFYKTGMESKGWKSETAMDLPNRSILAYEKGNRAASVMIAADKDGGSVITLTSAAKND